VAVTKVLLFLAADIITIEHSQTPLPLKTTMQFSLPVPERHITGVEVEIHSFLTLALYKDEWLTSRPDPFTTRKERRQNLNRRLCGPLGRYGCFGKEKNSLTLSGIRTRPIQPVIQPI
jgi:hypothetical protein